MGRGTLPKVRNRSGILRKVRDGSGDPPKGLGWVGGSSRRSGMGRKTLPEVGDGLVNPFRGPGRVVRPFRRCRMDRGTL